MKSQAFTVLDKNKEPISAGVFIETQKERFIQFAPALHGVDKKEGIEVRYNRIKNMGGFIASQVAATSKYKKQNASFVVVNNETLAVTFEEKEEGKTTFFLDVKTKKGESVILSSGFITGTDINGEKVNIPLETLTIEEFAVPENMNYGKNKVLNYLLTKAKVPVDKILPRQKNALLQKIHREIKKGSPTWMISERVGGVIVNVNSGTLWEAEKAAGMSLP